jgi:hypothetical protein
MVVPDSLAELCPQCGADVRASGSRCESCGFWLPAAPAPRTGPPLPRPVPVKDNSRRIAAFVLLGGGVVALGLFLSGILVGLRRSDATAVTSTATVPPPPPVASQPASRPEPNKLFGEARRKANAWHQDAVLVSFSASGLDATGLATQGVVEITYARPAGQRISGGAEASAERLVLRTNGAALGQSEKRASTGRIVPEPNCMFENAWAAAQSAGAASNAGLSMRYQWSDKHARPIWEVLSPAGEVQRRLDGVNCSILTR